MKNDTKISVVIPTYNRARLIKKSITSILNQTYKNIEIVVVDDASSDNTEEIVKSIEDSRIKYIKLKKNSGACVARNMGIKAAKGKYISFNDSDDEYLPEKIEIQYNNLIKNNSDMDFCKVRIFIDNCELIVPDDMRINEMGRKGYLKELLAGNYISTQAILVKKSVITKYMFDEKLPRFQDYDLVLRMAADVNMSFTDDILVNIYNSKDSISNSNEKLLEAVKIMINKKYNMNEEYKEMLRLFLIQCYANISNKNYVNCIDDLNNKSKEIDRLNKVVYNQQQNINALQSEIDKIINSKSWKITKPLRIVTNKLSKLK